MVWCSVGGRADPDAGVVDEHVETAVALAVAAHDLADRLLLPEVRRDVLDLEPALPQLAGRALERVGVARGDRQAEALLAERLREGESDSA